MSKWYWRFLFASKTLRTTDRIDEVAIKGRSNWEIIKWAVRALGIIDRTHSAWRAVDRRSWRWRRSRSNPRRRWRASRPDRSARSPRRPSNSDTWRSFSGSRTGPSGSGSPAEVFPTAMPVPAGARWDSEVRLCRQDCSVVPGTACRERLRRDSAKRSSRSLNGRPISGCQSSPTESPLLKFDSVRETLVRTA